MEIQHLCHEHPLTLTEARVGGQCFGCWRYFSGEPAYGCSMKCWPVIFLHEECAEMPREIRHPTHPQHILTQIVFDKLGNFPYTCTVCGRRARLGLVYHCSLCKFYIDLSCVAVRYATEKQTLQHPSHPTHQLTLLKRFSLFRCDACGTKEKARSYVCSDCQFWIHESCASLPTTMERESHHHHPLSLAFHLPEGYHKFGFKCDICRKHFLLRNWVYHCDLCRYVVHIKCALKTSIATQSASSSSSIKNEADEEVIRLPLNDVYEDLIKPFVMRGGAAVVPEINGKYRFHNHLHELSLVEEDDCEEEDDDDDDPDRESMIPVCNGCTTPIYEKSSPPPHMYYSCGECKYFLHLKCFQLPPELPPHPHREDKKHNKLRLESCPKNCLGMSCHNCYQVTNGLFYSCPDCDFKVDIKCASLPNTIDYAAHPQHYLKQFLVTHNCSHLCDACGQDLPYGRLAYRCERCELVLDYKCALLPSSIKHRWDQHPLPLTYDANVDHPSEFYCEICELEMNPKSWMYHCRQCDQSFHPTCLPLSGDYKNIKFGQQYVISNCHPRDHPLTHVQVATKLRCDLCRQDVYGFRGFECASCKFVMCLSCADEHKDAIQDD
ncbi:hypothetical protein Pfo_020322 [Paulownia fortunei]|nr:hypothetical protein Pfo_020322 [Paulownia fortunei]